MALCCEDEDDPDGSIQLEKALANFEEDIAEKFRTEYEGDSKTARDERIKLRHNNLDPWDQFLSTKDRNAIARLNLELYNLCPYLQKTRNSKSFYYCQIRADNVVEKHGIKYTGCLATIASAEYLAIIIAPEMKLTCIGKYESCAAKIRKEKDD